MAKSHKDQHWIPQSYLAAWTDPDVPAGHTPFVHVFSRDGSRERCKAPTNIFKETDLYTIIMPDGTRDLQLERGLTGLEQAFCKIRRDFLDHRRSLPTVRHANTPEPNTLALFGVGLGLLGFVWHKKGTPG